MTEIVLVPQPKKIIAEQGYLELSREEEHELDSYVFGSKCPACVIPVLLEYDGKPPEWYMLETGTEGVRISFTDERGLFYGIQTLRQLLINGGNGRLPHCVIEDSPDYPVRGVLLDISRDRVPRIETLKELIDKLASWKYNQLQLYTEHTFAYKSHREVWKDASPYTADDIIEIRNYCAARCIELVPNQNSFGHMERWLRHEQYRHLAESPDGFTDPWGVYREYSSTLAPAVPETLDFLSGLYDELLPCFESEYLNVGGDEPWELGKGRSMELCDRAGIDHVYLDFLMKIREKAAERGKRIQIYGDIIMKYPRLIRELPDDLILVNWGYEADHPFPDECEKLSSSGIPFYICTGVSSWNSIGGRWSNTRENIKSGAVNGIRFGAEGFIVSEWGDNGHWQQFTAGLPGFLYGAAAAWNAEGLDGFDTERGCSFFVFGDERLAAASARIQDVWACPGIALHNVSLPAVLLLDPLYPYYRGEYRRFAGYDFAAEFELLSGAEALLESAADSVMKDELSFTAALLKHGCRLGKQQLAAEEYSIAGIPKGVRIELARELEPLMAEYERLWHLRSRSGGLKDSAGRFSALLEAYKK